MISVLRDILVVFVKIVISITTEKMALLLSPHSINVGLAKSRIY